jgi:hypothetical protein
MNVVNYIAMTLPCEDGSRREYKSVAQREMFLRLHKKKCDVCRTYKFNQSSSDSCSGKNTTRLTTKQDLVKESHQGNIKLDDTFVNK